ncbi:hypothetical protein BJD20_17925 [Acinetobacter proteolyticus]|uniref:hypothetical protein n=1 Tax=Acinetobacter proteolyticus TaxID=1776741 RepID=UPI0008634434|nr:hypothetical protein [Acinetobacter proteolyticus]OEY94922.1 hypothetical protein BJD20_17925 [Acinetobacter proteolyticus]
MKLAQILLTLWFLSLTCHTFAQLTDVVVPPTVIKTEKENNQARNISRFKLNVYNKVMQAWEQPADSHGQIAVARTWLDDEGNIEKLIVESDHSEMIKTAEKAIRAVAPFTFPEDIDDLSKLKILNIRFKSW